MNSYFLFESCYLCPINALHSKSNIQKNEELESEVISRTFLVKYWLNTIRRKCDLISEQA